MRFLIDGPTTIHGTISVAGAKNAALPFIAAAIAVDEPLTVARVPAIEDVARMLEIAQALGADVQRSGGGAYTIDARPCTGVALPAAIASRLRASILFLGPLLGRFGEVLLPNPGGCAIGRRPIDLFLDGIRAFGCTVEEQPEGTLFRGTPSAARYVFPFVSVTGTETLLLLAARTRGTSVIENVALEPEVTALAELLVQSGATIEGIGTPTLRITGVDRLRGGSVACIPDRIETASFAAAVAACGGDLTITDCVPEHVAVPLAILRTMGVEVTTDTRAGTMHIAAMLPLRAVPFRTHEYPGLATDAQPPLTVAMTQASGVVLIQETVYEGRLYYVDTLNKMGANITLCDPHRCVIEGPKRLHGTTLESPDIRAGIALLIAAACAEGRSTIENIYQIDRGYERIEERLRTIGVNIRRTDE